jgi:hypothetical protein
MAGGAANTQHDMLTGSNDAQQMSRLIPHHNMVEVGSTWLHLSVPLIEQGSVFLTPHPEFPVFKMRAQLYHILSKARQVWEISKNVQSLQRGAA